MSNRRKSQVTVLAGLALAGLMTISTAQAQSNVNCNQIQSLGASFTSDIINELNREVAGDAHRISRRKTLHINQVDSVRFNGCRATINANVTLQRKVRRNAHGSVTIGAEVSRLALISQTRDALVLDVCISNPRVTRVRLSRTLRIGEAVYRWVANRVVPSRHCQQVTVDL